MIFYYLLCNLPQEKVLKVNAEQLHIYSNTKNAIVNSSIVFETLRCERVLNPKSALSTEKSLATTTKTNDSDYS